MCYSERATIIIRFVNVKYPLPIKHVPNKYSFNERDIEASEFLAKDKDKKVGAKGKGFDFGVRQMFEKIMREKPKSEESIEKRTKMERQNESDDNESDTPEKTRNFVDFLKQFFF